MKTILVLGGGIGGVVMAKGLRKKLAKTHRIMVFEKEEKHVFGASLLWLMVGKRKPHQVFRSLQKLIDSGIEVIKGEIEKVSPENLVVSVNGKKYKGDHMVISLGVEQTPEQRKTIYPPKIQCCGQAFIRWFGLGNFWKCCCRLYSGSWTNIYPFTGCG